MDALELTTQERGLLNTSRRRQVSISSQAGDRDSDVPPVGRAAEAQTIELLLLGSDWPVLALSGEPGVGKSHLMRWAAGRARQIGIPVFTGGCLRQGVQQPYAPLLNALQAWVEQQHPDMLRSALRDCGWLVRMLPELELYLDDLPPSGSLPPNVERRLVTGALTRLLRQSSRRRGALLLLDDLQWAAQDTLDMLAALAVTNVERSVRMVLAYRSNEVRPGSVLTGVLVDLAHRGLVRHLSLAPLDAQAARELLEQASTRDLGATELDYIVVRTGGVPFYLVSYAQELQRSSIYDGLPWSVSQSILQRLAMLSETGQSVMRVGAVVGRVLNPVILSAVTGVPRIATLAALDEAVDEGLVVVREDEYAFSHDVVKDVIERDLSPGFRLGGHEAVAAVLESLYATELENWYEELAYHYTVARVPQKAFSYLMKSAHKALTAGATTEALRLCGLALEACDVLGANASAEQVDVLELRGNLLFALGQYRAMAADFGIISHLAHVRSDDRLLAAARTSQGTGLLYDHDFAGAEAALRSALELALGRFEVVELRAAGALTDLLYVTGRVEEAQSVFGRVAELADRVDDAAGRAYVQVLLAPFILQWEGRFSESLDAAQQGSPLVEASGELGLALWRAWHLGLARGSRGDYEPALACLQEAVQDCHRLGDSVVRARILNTMGWIYCDLGGYARAIELNEQSLCLANETGTPDPEIQNNARINLADCLFLQGLTNEADSHLEVVERIVRQPSPQDRWMLWRYSQRLFHTRGEICLSRGDLDLAQQYADECLQLAHATRSRKNIVKGNRLRAEIYLAQRLLVEASETIAGAVILAREVQNPPQLWRTLTIASRVYAAMHDTNAARSAVTEALQVVTAVAAGLRDADLRASFFASPPVRQVLELVAPKG